MLLLGELNYQLMSNKDYNLSPRVDQVGILDRVARVQARSIKKEAKIQGLKMALNICLLYTSPSPRDA